MIYFFPIILAIFFANIFDFKKEIQGRMFCYALLCIILICIAGFRYRVGGDTIRYMENFKSYHVLSQFTANDFQREGVMPLSVLFFSLCKTISPSFYFLQFVHAFIINVTVFWFIKKHTRFIFSTVLFYMVWSYLEFNTEIIKESISICIILLGIDNIAKKRYVRYFIFCIFALGFHLSAIVAFVFPLFYKLKLNFGGIIVFIGSMGLFTALYAALPEYFDALNFITEDAETLMLRYYGDEVEGGNFSTLILYSSQWIILPLFSILLVKKGAYSANYEFVGLVMLGIMLSYFTQYSFAFHRFLNYLTPYFWLLLGTAMASLPTVKVFHGIRKNTLLLILLFFIYATISINLTFMIPGKEDVYKYFPYTSMFNEQKVYRPEW